VTWRRRTRVPAALISAVILAVGGCSGGTDSAPGVARGAPAGAERGAPFVYSSNVDVVTDWDPATSYSNEIIALQNVYESLTRYDSRSRRVTPLLATEWTASRDGRTWTFTLRDGVRFHTGRTLDATAAKEAIERTIAMKGRPANIWAAVRRITAEDPRTLVFSLAYAAPLDLIAAAGYAAYIYDTRVAPGQDLREWFEAGRDTGTGPYTVASWHRGQETELRLGAVRDYWGGWAGAHYRDVEFRVTPEVTTAWQLLRRGEVTFADRLSPQLFAQAEHTRNVRTTRTTSFQNLLALFNTASGPLTDPRVRKAVQRAVDYDGLVAALRGAAAPASGLVPRGLLGHVSRLRAHQDLAGAARLLAEAGYGPGRRPLDLTLTYAQGDQDQQLFVTLLTSALSVLGVRLDARPMQWTAQWSQAGSRDKGERQDIFVMYWFPDYPDGYSWFGNLIHSADPPRFNLTYDADKAVDTEIDRLPRLTATDRGAAQRAYGGLQRRVLADAAIMAVPFVRNYQRAYGAGVQGYRDNPAYPGVVFVHGLRPGS
jgi:peptide/nickel transport system substrate-binding protein